MSIVGIDQITYGVSDVREGQRFFEDWGLRLGGRTEPVVTLETLNGNRVVIAPMDFPSLPPAFEAGPTLREIVWGVSEAADLDRLREDLSGMAGFATDADGVGCTDPNGLAIRFQISRARPVGLQGARTNAWNAVQRVDTPAPVYDHAEPLEIGHVVVFTDRLDAMERFYGALGFIVSDRYPGRGLFMRSAPAGGHHDFFMLQLPTGKRGLNHVAFTLRDIHEVFGGGLAFSRRGGKTQLGPGRHPISSAYFWYFENPCGGLVEYCADEDVLTAAWQPRSFQPSPEVFAEWAIEGGVDGHTRRQASVAAPDGRHLSEKR